MDDLRDKIWDCPSEDVQITHSRFSQNPSQAKNQKNSSNESKAIFQYLCMSKVYAEILRIGFPSCFRDFGP